MANSLAAVCKGLLRACVLQCAVPAALSSAACYACCMLRLGRAILPLCHAADRAQVAQQWNEVRKEIIRSAVKDQLVPAFRAHFQSKLLQDAREAAARK